MLTADTLTALKLDPAAPLPLFRQLYEAIKQAVLDGRLSPGTRLPPTRALAGRLAVSRQTVLSAYEQLTAEGYLAGTVGRGTFVAAHLPGATPFAPPAHDAPLRPLSARGMQFHDSAPLNTHAGRARAFRIGMSGADCFPFDVWARLQARHWRRPRVDLGYADPAGFKPLRELLATYLRASRGVHCAPEQVIVTSGSQQGLFLVASLLLAPGDSAWVECPGYPGTCAALRSVGARIVPVPVDAHGMDVAEGIRRAPRAGLAYVTPSHQYPLGATMSLSRRLQLLAHAAERRMWIVEDEYDSEYRYTGPPIASLQSMDQAGAVIYVGTLSKVLFPGLRLGYLVVPPPLIEAFTRGKAAIDRHSATVTQAVVADFMADGHFGRHIRRTRELYAERREAFLAAFDDHLAEHLVPGPADAGMHVATALRGGGDDAALARKADAAGVEVRALSPFYAGTGVKAGSVVPPGLLLGYAAVTPDEIRAAAATLGRVLRDRRTWRP